MKDSLLLAKLNGCEIRGNDWVELAKRLYEVTQEKKLLMLSERKLIDDLKAMSDHKSSAGGDPLNGDFKFEITERLGVVNYKIVPELRGLDLEQYRKEGSESWKLSKI